MHSNVSSIRKGLKVEVETARAGHAGEAVVLVLRPDKLPRALVTGDDGVVRTRVISYVDLLATLDRSTTVDLLSQEPTRRLPLPPLPSGTVLVDALERPSGNAYVLTGTIPTGEHLFALTRGGETTTFMLRLPKICYRVVWSERTRAASEFSLALCSPALTGEPTADTPLFRWPFSNVYDHFGGIKEGVCWYQYKQVETDLAAVPERLVRSFVAIPNEADRYAGDLTHNAPVGSYESFLEAVEEGGGIPHEWLVPCNSTIRELHEQHGRSELR
ncbi:MAG: hypothetical protein WA982_05785 [Rubrobacteraceae bacterium]